MMIPTPAMMPWTIRSSDLAVAPMLAAYFVGGIVSVITGTPTVVETALGDVWDTVWLCMLIGGPVATMTGMLVRDQWAGTWLRMAGGLAISGAMAGFWVGLVHRFGWSTLTVWIAAGLTLSTIILVIGDIVQVCRIGRLAKVIERGIE